MAVTTEINGQRITFDVVEDSDGMPALKATHIGGVEVAAGFIAGITASGKLMRYGGVNTRFNFKLTATCHIKQIKEGE